MEYYYNDLAEHLGWLNISSLPLHQIYDLIIKYGIKKYHGLLKIYSINSIFLSLCIIFIILMYNFIFIYYIFLPFENIYKMLCFTAIPTKPIFKYGTYVQPSFFNPGILTTNSKTKKNLIQKFSDHQAAITNLFNGYHLFTATNVTTVKKTEILNKQNLVTLKTTEDKTKRNNLTVSTILHNYLINDEQAKIITNEINIKYIQRSAENEINNILNTHGFNIDMNKVFKYTEKYAILNALYNFTHEKGLVTMPMTLNNIQMAIFSTENYSQTELCQVYYDNSKLLKKLSQCKSFNDAAKNEYKKMAELNYNVFELLKSSQFDLKVSQIDYFSHYLIETDKTIAFLQKAEQAILLNNYDAYMQIQENANIDIWSGPDLNILPEFIALGRDLKNHHLTSEYNSKLKNTRYNADKEQYLLIENQKEPIKDEKKVLLHLLPTPKNAWEYDFKDPIRKALVFPSKETKQLQLEWKKTEETPLSNNKKIINEQEIEKPKHESETKPEFEPKSKPKIETGSIYDIDR